MGTQRRIGHDFERLIARKLKDMFPGRTIHRSSQADRAYNGDVVIEPMDEAGDDLSHLWIECHTSIDPYPRVKMRQAIRDIGHRYGIAGYTLITPVVVWKKRARCFPIQVMAWEDGTDAAYGFNEFFGRFK
jgi:hypothetical protein